MSYRSYLTLDELSDIWQNGCIPLSWLALCRSAEPLDEAPDADDSGAGFWGYRTSAWEAIDSLDRAIAILQKQPYLWAYFNVLALLLEEVQQLPSEEEITIDCSEFAQHSPERAEAARAAAENWRLVMRHVQHGEIEEALGTLRALSDAVSLDQGLPFTGDLERDVVVLGGRTTALEELVWTVIGEIYEGPEERLEFFTPKWLQTYYWTWLAGMPDDPPPVDADAVPRNGRHSPTGGDLAAPGEQPD
jgi:hypothetical protein